MLLAHAGDDLVSGYVNNHCVELIGNFILLYLIDKALRILGAGELLLVDVKAEAVMDALVEYAARLVFALEDEDVADALSVSLGGGGKAGRSGSDDY